MVFALQSAALLPGSDGVPAAVGCGLWLGGCRLVAWLGRWPFAPSGLPPSRGLYSRPVRGYLSSTSS